MGSIIWIGYTTQYRDGGPMLKRAAETLAGEHCHEGRVVCVPVNSKQAFVDAMRALSETEDEVTELHFVGHSGMYGPMFGTVSWPQQFSPYEWRNMSIPFAKPGSAYFHCCRSARWFAPFFARTFGVPAYGYSWYTTFSSQKHKFRWPHPLTSTNAPIYVFGCAGRKSHGLLGSLRKYTGLVAPEAMKRFAPSTQNIDTSYDPVASLYDQAYSDIRVRKDEWTWLTNKLGDSAGRVLDIGCGNGALLNVLAPSIEHGLGVDVSSQMLTFARKNNSQHSHLVFSQVCGPELPCEDSSVDTVISLLSFRYLDWDPLMREVRRVLAPGGRLLIIDMVASPPRWRELQKLVTQKIMERLRTSNNRPFRKHLDQLVADERWQHMLQFNPIRSEHEMRWYLQSRFRSAQIDTLNISLHARILAFDSGPIDKVTKTIETATP